MPVHNALPVCPHQEPRTMTTFRLDPLYPDVLVCCRCSAAVATVAGPAPAEGELTGQQAVLAWPDEGEAIRRHEVLCGMRHAGGELYVHMLEREAEATP